MSLNKPNLEEIRKQNEESSFQKWSQMVLKQKDKQKHMEKTKKENNAIKAQNLEK